MNEGMLICYCLAAGVVTLLLLTGQVVGLLRARRRVSSDQELRSKYLHIMMLSLMSGQDEVPYFPKMGRLGARMLLAETLAGMAGATSGLDPVLFQRIVERYGLDEWLLARIRFMQGYRRARCLALLSRLPADGVAAAGVVRYLNSDNRYVRFYALTTQLAADPSTALRAMSDYDYPLSSGELAEIMTLLRRGMLPVAYEPLIASPNRNLRMLGMAIVRQFGVEQAEELLLRIVAADESPELVREALYTLCALRRPLSGRRVAASIAAMSAPERKALLRFMAAEGYSPGVIGRLLGKDERPYYESLVQSYKRSLA